MSERVPQRQAEIRAMARLAGDELGGAVDGIATIHRAVSDRVFAAVRWGVGPAAEPVKVVHDAITDGVYRIVSGAAVTAGVVGERAADLPGGPPSRTVWGSGFVAALQGLVGDSLEERVPVLAGPMTVRVDGNPVAPEAIAGHVPPHDHLVVFLHGLVETEHAWRWGGRATYAERLATELPCACVQVRYNSGLHISENARELAELMDRLVAHWPVPVRRISLVGHSMGGLVARAACFDAREQDRGWVRLVREIVCLGSPHLGAPLEQVVHRLSAALVWLPETRPMGRMLRRRSAGIRDLRHGSLVDEDWRGVDADALERRAVREVPLLEGAEHYFVTATFTRSPRHPFGRFVGDGLVLAPSGAGRNRVRRLGFAEDNGLHVPGAHHFALLNHESVYAALRRWLGSVPAAALGPGRAG